MDFRVALNPAIGIVLGISLMLGSAWAQKVQSIVPKPRKYRRPTLCRLRRLSRVLQPPLQTDGQVSALLPN
jgi:hypothetical protein